MAKWLQHNPAAPVIPDEMVERAARAMWRAMVGSDWVDAPSSHRIDYLFAAREALTAAYMKPVN